MTLLCLPALVIAQAIPGADAARAAIAAAKVPIAATQLAADVPESCRGFTGTFFGESDWWPSGKRVHVINVREIVVDESWVANARVARFLEYHQLAATAPVCRVRVGRWLSANSDLAVTDQPEVPGISADGLITIDPADGRPVMFLLHSRDVQWFQRLKHLGDDRYEYAWVMGRIARWKPYVNPYGRIDPP